MLEQLHNPDHQLLRSSRRRRVVILGSTGSIGTQALDIIRSHPEDFDVVGLSAGSQAEALADQVAEFSPKMIGIADPNLTEALAQELQRHHDHGHGPDTPRAETTLPRILSGAKAAPTLASDADADIVLNAITGSIGLESTLATLGAGKILALANKESLVVGGALVRQALQYPGQIVPVDSEHSAIAQALLSGVHRAGMSAGSSSENLRESAGQTEVRKLILTASGGPFRHFTPEQLAAVTPQQALTHPNFAMGAMVTTNSATMVNKALEVIEAHLLFDVDLADIDVVIHPQQFIHSMVEFCDGATMAQAGIPRMLVPIAWGLAYPQRLHDVDTAIDFTQAMSWDFSPLDDAVFPAVGLAKRAAATSGWHMAVFNAANETAVAAFHRGELRFDRIVSTIAAVIEATESDAACETFSCASYDELMRVDTWARSAAAEIISAAADQPAANAEQVAL